MLYEVITIIAAPNLFGDDPALQITREDGAPLAATTVDVITSALNTAEIEYLSTALDGSAALIRFPDVASQLEASTVIGEELPFHVVALTLAPRTPPILRALGLQPMSLGLSYNFV